MLKIVGSTVALLLLLSLEGCGCGFDCNSGNDDGIQVSSFSLAFSDEPVEDLKAVVIEVTRITLQRSVADNVVVETFSIPELGLVDAESFQVDLLDYRGLNRLQVISDLELDTGSYSAIAIAINGGDINASYVQQSDDTLIPVSVADGQLSLPGVALSGATEDFTVEFELALALRERPDLDDYRLDETGLRVEDTDASASITGRVDNSLFDTETDCASKQDPERGNRLYLYSGIGLDETLLADVFRSTDSVTTVPDDAIAPFAVAVPVENALTGNWEYAFGHLPEGDYTLAFSCNSDNDDAVDYDGIAVPLPAAQLYEISLSPSEQATCDLEDSGSCG